jgi:hypothetical protein
MLDFTWRDLYTAAIVEVDPAIRKIRVTAAANAIKARASEGGVSGHERTEMGDALATLSRLKPCATV